MKKVLIFDMNNLMMRCLYAFKYGPEEKEFREFKNTFVKSFLKTIQDNHPDKVICCRDNTSWRKEVNSTYKENRKVARDTSIINFEVFFAVAERLICTMQNVFENIQFLSLEKCEADDLIAVITKNNPDWQITNISTDKDFYQLFKYPNYAQYDGMKHDFIQVLNPEMQLMTKIILGDKGDNIQQLKKGVGIKSAEKILAEGLDEWLDKENLRERYEENMKLISFDCIPQEISSKIIKAVNEFVPGKLNGQKFTSMTINEGLPDIFMNLSVYMETIKRLS